MKFPTFHCETLSIVHILGLDTNTGSIFYRASINNTQYTCMHTNYDISSLVYLDMLNDLLAFRDSVNGPNFAMLVASY